MIKYSEQYKDNEGRTWVDLTIYNGKTYPCRVAKAQDGDDLLIAGDSLLNVIKPYKECRWNEYDPVDPKSAKEVDDAIFHFTDDTSLYYSDAELREKLKEEHPEWFED